MTVPQRELQLLDIIETKHKIIPTNDRRDGISESMNITMNEVHSKVHSRFLYYLTFKSKTGTNIKTHIYALRANVQVVVINILCTVETNSAYLFHSHCLCKHSASPVAVMERKLIVN